MKNAIARICTVLLLFLFGQIASAMEQQSASVESILRELKESTSPEDFQQIADAIVASDVLQRELNELVTASRFSGFLVSPRAQVMDGRASIFGGFTQGQRIVLTTEFLKELKKSRLVDVVYPDDVSPNNTAFVLAHLLYHMKTPLDPRKYSSPDMFAAAAIKIEAGAFIQAWNAMLQVAERDNGAKPLSARQVGQLLMNTRYRFALIGAMRQKVDPLQFTPTGSVEANDRNIQAIAATLRNSGHADLE